MQRAMCLHSDVLIHDLEHSHKAGGREKKNSHFLASSPVSGKSSKEESVFSGMYNFCPVENELENV